MSVIRQAAERAVRLHWQYDLISDLQQTASMSSMEGLFACKCLRTVFDYVRSSFSRFPATCAATDDRYVLWAFSRYSQGDAPSTFIQPQKPPKKFRG